MSRRMGRKRVRGKGLPARVYLSRGWYFYAHPTPGEGWKKLAREGHLAEMYRALAMVQAGPVAGTMAAGFKKYREEILPSKAKKTRTQQTAELARLEAWSGKADPDAMTAQDVVGYLTARLDKTGAPAPVAANREVALLSHIFTKMIRWNLAKSNPCLGVERNEEEPRRHKIADMDLMRAWTIAKPWMRALIVMAYVAGQRKGDTRKIREADFTHLGLEVDQGKTDTELLARWTPNLRAARAYALKVREDTLATCKVRPITKWLFCSVRGTPPSESTMKREWTRIMDELERQGGERFDFRDIRPRSATDHATGEHLGHKDPRVLARHYRLGRKVVTPL